MSRCICIYKYIKISVMTYEELCETVGLKIKFYRQKLHLTQAQFAEMLDMDVRYLSDIERGKKNITLKTIHKIAFGLKKNAKDLF